MMRNLAILKHQRDMCHSKLYVCEVSRTHIHTQQGGLRECGVSNLYTSSFRNQRFEGWYVISLSVHTPHDEGISFEGKAGIPLPCVIARVPFCRYAATDVHARPIKYDGQSVPIPRIRLSFSE